MGEPAEDSDHNCDALGCSSLDHVESRRRLTAEQMQRLGDGDRVGLSGVIGSVDDD